MRSRRDHLVKTIVRKKLRPLFQLVMVKSGAVGLQEILNFEAQLDGDGHRVKIP
jgi:hypothetical protein